MPRHRARIHSQAPPKADKRLKPTEDHQDAVGRGLPNANAHAVENQAEPARKNKIPRKSKEHRWNIKKLWRRS